MNQNFPATLQVFTWSSEKHAVLCYPDSGEVKVTQSCPILCNPMDYTVHGILQARILEWVAFPFFKVSSQPRDQIQVSCIADGVFTSWATREAHPYGRLCIFCWLIPDAFHWVLLSFGPIGSSTCGVNYLIFQNALIIETPFQSYHIHHLLWIKIGLWCS